MLEASGLLNALFKNECDETYTNHNDDYDFRQVLEFCSDSVEVEREILYSDGAKRVLSFD